MQKLDLFGTGLNEKAKQVSTTKITNMYLEQSEEGEIVAYQRTGWDVFLALGETPIRGMLAVDNLLYVVIGNKVYLIKKDKSSLYLGTIDSFQGKVSMTENGIEIFLATDVSGYIINLTTNSLTAIIAAGYTKGNCAQFNTGFFISVKPESMQFNISGLYNGTNWDALDYASAESNPDDLVTCVVNQNVLVLFGTKTTEFWTNNGNSLFPYASSGLAAEWGLAARWSVAKFDNSLIYLASNSLGEVQVVRLSGYTPSRVSTTAIEAIINNFTTVEDAVGFAYLYEGHAFYQLNFPTENRSFCYDSSTNLWTEVISYGLGRHVGDLLTVWGDAVYLTDYRKGTIYVMNKASSYDGDLLVVGEVISKHFKANQAFFPVSSLEVAFSAGQKATNTDNPQISLTVSRDGGNTWGAEVFRPMGKLGEYKSSAKWSRLGASKDFVFKIRIADAVDKAIIGAFVS